MSKEQQLAQLIDELINMLSLLDEIFPNWAIRMLDDMRSRSVELLDQE